MFEEEELQSLNNLGYSVSASGEVTDSEGFVIPPEIYNKEISSNSLFPEEGQVSIEQDFTQTDSYQSILRQEKELAQKQVNRFLEDPDNNTIDSDNPYIAEELKTKGENGDIKYNPEVDEPIDYVTEQRDSSDNPILKELAELDPALAEDYIYTNNRIKEIESKDEDVDNILDDVNKDLSKESADKAWYNPTKLGDIFFETLYSGVQLLSPTGTGMTDPKLKKEYLQLLDEQKSLENNVLKSKIDKSTQEAEVLKENVNRLLESEDLSSFDRTILQDLVTFKEDRNKELTDVLQSDSNSAFSNVINAFQNQGKKSIKSIFFADAMYALLSKNAGENYTEGEASEVDKLILSNYFENQSHNSLLGSMTNTSEAYKVSEGVTGSLGFIGELMGSKGVGKGISMGVKKGLNKIGSETMKKGIAKASKKLGSELGEDSLKKITANLIKDGLMLPLGMGSTYTKAIENENPMVLQPDGTLLMGKKAYTHNITQLEADKNVLKKEYEKLSSKKDLTDQEKKELELAMSSLGIDGMVHGVERNKALPTIDSSIEKMQSMEGFGSFYNAWVENSAEVISEGVGAFGLGGRFSNLLRKNKVTKTLVDNKLVDNFNKYSNSINKFSGGHIHGVFDELIEENLVPYIKAGLTGQDTHEIYGMMNWNAQKDVAIQTLAMNALFRVPGAIQSNLTKEGREQKAYLKSIKSRNKADKKRLSELYRNISTVKDEAELNDIIDLTAIPGQNTEHTLNQATNLRAQGKEAEAKDLEETLFHYNAIAAVATGTESDFKWAMEQLQKDGKRENLASSQNAITKALTSLEKYKEIKNVYKNKQGSDLIVQNLFNKELHEQEIEKTSKDITSRITKNRAEVTLFERAIESKLEEFGERPHTDAVVGSTILGKNFASLEDQSEYNELLKTVSEKFSPELQAIVGVSVQKLGTLQNSLQAINSTHITLNNRTIQRGLFADKKVKEAVYKGFLENQGNLTDAQIEKIAKETIDAVKKGDPSLGEKPTNVSKEQIENILKSTKKGVKEVKRKVEIVKNTEAKAKVQEQLQLDFDSQETPVVENSEMDSNAFDIVEDALAIDIDQYGEASTLDAETLALLDNNPKAPLESRRKVVKPLPKKFIEAIKNYAENNLQSSLGREATFQDLIEGLIKSSTYKKIDDTFDTYAKAWKALGKDTSNVESVYNTFFSPVSSIVEMGMDLIDPNVTTTATEEEVEEQVEKEEIASEIATTKRKQYNPNTGIATNTETTVDDGKTLSSDYKFAYNFQQLKLVNGVYKILSRNLRPIKEIDPNSSDPIELVDNRYILDSDFTSKLKREKTPLTVKAIDINEVAVGNGKTWGEVKAEHAGDTEWIQNNMPMVVIYDNPNSDLPVVLSMVHTTDWYQAKNISTRSSEVSPEEVIKEGIEKIQALREQVIKNGEATITIDNVSTGAWHKTNNQLDTTPLPISEATGESTLGVMKRVGNSLVPVVNSRGEAFNKGIVQTDLEDGKYGEAEVVDIRQVATNSDGQPIYRVFKVLVDNPTLTDKPNLKNDLKPWIVENLKWATLTSTILNNKDNVELLEAINKKYNFNITKAEKLNKEVYSQSGISLEVDLAKYYGVFVQVGQKNTTLQDRFKKAPQGISLFDNNVNNEIIISNKSSDVFGKMSIGSKSTNTKSTLGNIERAFGSLGIVGKSQFNLDVRHLDKVERLKISKISKGEVVPDSAQTFDQVFKSLLKTNLVSHEIQTISGEKKWVTAIQPKITFKLQDTAKEVVPTVLEKAQEAVSKSVDVSTPMDKVKAGLTEEQRVLLEQMMASGQVKTQGTLESRRIINNAEREAIDNFKTTKIKGLTNKQESEIRSSLMNLIITNLDFTDKFNTGSVKEAISASVETHLLPLLSNLQSIYDNISSIPGLEVSAQDFKEKIEVLENVLEQQDKLVSVEAGSPGSITTAFNSLLGEVFEEDVDIVEGVEAHSKSFLEKDITLSYSNQLKLSLYGYPKTNKNNNPIVNFLGTPEFHSADDVVNKLKEITSTTPSNWDKLLDRLEIAAETRQDPLYLSIKNKIEKHPPHLKWELLYKNISKKLNIYKVINSIKDKSISVNGKPVKVIESYNMQVYDENSNKEEIRWRQEIKGSFMSVGFATLNHKANVVMNKQYAQNIQKKLVEYALSGDVSFKAIREQFNAIGLEQFSDNTVADFIKDNSKSLYDKGGLLSMFNNELTRILKNENDIDLEEPANFPYNNLGGKMNQLIEKEITLNGNFVASSIRVNGKTMQGVISNTSFYDITQELSDADSPTLDAYLSKEYTKGNFLLNYLKDDKKFRESFTKIGFSSPDSYKLHGANNSGETSIDKISEQDNLANTFGVYSNTRGNLGLTDKENKIPGVVGVEFRAGQMLSNTLSDKGRLLYMSTLLANLKRNQVTFSDNGEVQFDVFLDEFLVGQMFTPEFNRIIQAHKETTNIKGYDSLAKMFLAIPSFNSIEVNGKNIHELLEGTKNGSVISEQDMATITEEASKRIRDYISSETRNKIDIKNKEGSLYRLGFYKQPLYPDKGETSIHNIDNKYIASKGINNAEEALRFFTAEFAINNMLNQNNIYQIYLGDLAFYTKDRMLPTKQIEYTDNTGKIVKDTVVDYAKVGDPAVYGKILKSIGAIVDKRAASLIAPGQALADSHNNNSDLPQKFMHIAMEDVIGITETMVELIEARYSGEFTDVMETGLNHVKDLKEVMKRDNISDNAVKIKDIGQYVISGDLSRGVELKPDTPNNIRSLVGLLDSLRLNTPFDNNALDADISLSAFEYLLHNVVEEHFTDLSGYFEIEGTDAQEYTTWGAHIDMLFRQGKLTQEEEMTLSSAYNKLSEGRGDEVTKEELSVIMQPVKPVYTGVIPHGNVMRPVYIKSSAFPLLPQLTKNLKLDDLRKKMEELEKTNNMPVRVSYQTANKIGALKSKLTMNSIYDKSLEDLQRDFSTATSILPMKNFKIQQETPSKENKYYKKNKDAQITMGSQFFKIILGNGINQEERGLFPNLFSSDLLHKLGLDPNKSMLSGVELDTIYREAYFEYSDTLQQDLHSELGIEVGQNFHELPSKEKTKVMKSLHKILKREVDTRDYPDFLKDSLDLVEDSSGNLETIMPLMFDPNSHKFESLLQALISNRLIVHTLPGNGHIAASSEGIKRKVTDLESLTEEKRKGIQWISGDRSRDLQPTYTENGELKEAEVLIQSHYKVYNEAGEASYIDLSTDEYTEDIVEYGKVVGRKLRLDKIDPQLLTNFTFRIPTSSHQSGVIIKVAGFLPREMGDILIVPKEHTTQLGEDYDIDKRFVYKSNYTVDSNGNIKKLVYENIEQKIKDANSLTKDLSDEASENVWVNLFKEFNSGDLQQELVEELKEVGITPNSKEVITASKKVLNKLKVKMLENTLIDIYKSVYSSPSPDIQKKIFKPLVTDIAEETADLMQSKLVAEEDLTNFSIFSDEYQRYLLTLGADGKGGIGVHSNAVTLEAQLQRVPTNKKVVLLEQREYEDISGNTKIKSVPFKDSLGGFTFESKLGNRIKTLDQSREVAEQHGENQNVSTDNINKGIMVKRNENTHTMSVYSLLAHMGYDLSMENVINENGEPVQMHLPSLFMNQPILRDYVKLKNMYSGITQDFNPNIDSEIIEMLATDYGFPLKERGKTNPSNFLQNSYNIEDLEKLLSGQGLWDSLKKEETSAEVQMAVLQKFFTYKKYAKQLSDVQGLINLSSSKLGVSYFESNQRVEMLNKVGKGDISLPGNSASLIGESIAVEDVETALEGYSKVGDFYWKPTTNEGKMLINSLSSADSILPIFYPYNSPTIKNMINNIFANKGEDSSKKSANLLRWKYEIMSELNNFISSNIGLSSNEVNAERERLFFETSNSKPLAWILQELKRQSHPIMENSLLKDLKPELGVGGKQSSISHFNTQGSTIDSNAKYNAFNELIQDETVLGVFNGEALTVSMLAQDLATYSYLSDNQNGATGFKNYISVPYLNALDITGNYRKIFKHLVKGGKNLTDVFERQYFQHKPQRAVVLDPINIGTSNTENTITINKNSLPTNTKGDKFYPNYVTVRNTKKRIGKEWSLYEKVKITGSVSYVEIETLGDDKYNEYNSTTAHQTSSLAKSLVNVGNDIVEVEEGSGRGKKKVIKVKLPNGEMFNYEQLNSVLRGKTVKELLRFFANNTLVKDDKRNLTLEILEYLDPNTKVVFGRPKNGVLGNYTPDNNTIIFHENLMREAIGMADNSFVKGFGIAREVVLEEALHSITATEFDKYVESKNQDNTNIVLKEDAPEFAKKIVAMFEAAKNNVPYVETDVNTYYSKNIYEFMAGVFVSPEYRAKLEESEKGILNDFKNMLRDLFKMLYKNRTNTTLSYDNEVFNAIKEMLQTNRVNESAVEDTTSNPFETFRKAQKEVVIPGEVSRPLQDKILSLQSEKKDPLNC